MATVGKISFASDYQSRKQKAWKNGVGVPARSVPRDARMIDRTITQILHLSPGQSLVVTCTEDGYEVKVEDIAGDPD